MKTIVTSIIILGSIFLLSGCNSNVKTELEDTNSKLVEANNRIDTLEEKVKELSDKSETIDLVYNSINLKLEEYDKNKVVADISLSYLKEESDYEKTIEYYKNQGEKVIAPEKSNGETLFKIKTTEKLTNITYCDTSKDFIQEGMDVEKDLRKYGIKNQGNLAKELNPGEVLIFSAHETEGIPMCYFYWTEPDGRIVYNSVTFDGKGDRYPR